MEKVFAQTLVITDDYDEYNDNCKLILKESIDENIYFNRYDVGSIEQYSRAENQFSLSLSEVSGEIFLPRNISLDLIMNKDIEGVIASPAFISGNGHVDLEIKTDSLLTLCLETKGSLILNGNINLLPCVIDGFETVGEDIQGMIYYYQEYQERAIKEKIFMDIDLAREFPKEPSTRYSDICRAFNVVYIRKDEGNLTNLRYRFPDEDEHFLSNMIIRDSVNHLQIALKKAVIDEKYEKASQLLHKIRFYEGNLNKCCEDDAYSNKIQMIFRK